MVPYMLTEKFISPQPKKGGSLMCPENILENPSRNNAREYVYLRLRDDIIAMKLEPGRMLTEKSVSEEMAVSRTPVREAFIRLEQDGLLVVRPQRGTYVSPIILGRIAEARLVRGAVEMKIMPRLLDSVTPARRDAMELNLREQEFHLAQFGLSHSAMAMFRLDNEFHRMQFAWVGMERVWDMIQQFSCHLNRVRILYLLAKEEWESLIVQHRAIFAAIVAGDPDAALEKLDSHLNRTDGDLDNLREKFPDYFA